VARPLTFRRRWPGFLILLFLLPVGFALPFTLWFSFVLSPLQKQYFPTYMAMAMTQGTARTFPVWWIWKTGPKHKSELADDTDVVSAPAADRKSLPLAVSPQARAKGWTELLRAKQMGSPQDEKESLQDEFFAGESFGRMMITPLCGMALAALLYLGFREKFGSQSKHEERHGRRTKGPELTSALGWARRGKADGIRLRLAGKLGLPGASFRIPKKLESSHILLMGDTGSGKSNAIRQILREVQKRGESAIVYDPAGEFVQEFYRPDRGDFILNPLDARCPFWNLNGELARSDRSGVSGLACEDGKGDSESPPVSPKGNRNDNQPLICKVNRHFGSDLTASRFREARLLGQLTSAVLPHKSSCIYLGA